MKLKRIILVLSVLCMLSGFLTACVKNRGKNLPTGEPTASAEKPSEAAKRVFTKIIDLDAEDAEQLDRFNAEGGQLTIENAAYAGACSFHFSEREDLYSGVTLEYYNKQSGIIDVVGKETHISVWVYHTTGKDATFSFTLNGKRQGSAAEMPIATTEVSGIPHRQWTLIETDIPVYSDILDPTVTFTMSSSDMSFYFDDLRLGYDPVSKVAETPDDGSGSPQTDIIPTPEPDGSREFTGLFYDFENGENIFGGKGKAAAAISKGGHESKQCVKVSGRKSYSDGAVLNLSLYRMAGKKVKLSFWVYHESKSPFFLKYSMQQQIGEEAGLTLGSEQQVEIKAGKWYKVEDIISFDAAAKQYLLYFESPQEYVTFYLDDVSIEIVP